MNHKCEEGNWGSMEAPVPTVMMGMGKDSRGDAGNDCFLWHGGDLGEVSKVAILRNGRDLTINRPV